MTQPAGGTVTQPSGLPARGGGGIELVEEVGAPTPGRIIYLTKKVEDRWKESDFNITLTPGDIGGPGEKVGYTDAAGAAAYNEFGKAGGMLSGGTDVIKGIGVQTTNQDGVLYVLLTATALATLVEGQVNKELRFEPLEALSFLIRQNDRNANDPVEVAGFKIVNSDRFGLSFSVAEDIPVAFRLLSTGMPRKGVLSSGGVATLGALKPNGSYEPDFYHASPDGKRWIKGLATPSGGGIPAALMLEQGLGNNALRQQRLKGLILGLEREDAGPDWTLTTADRMEDAVQATVQFQSGGQNPATFTVTFPPLRDNSGAGTGGNGWQLVVTAGNVLGARLDTAARTWTIVSPVGTTYAQAAQAVNNSSAGAAVVTGPGNTLFGNSGNFVFAGGADPEPIGAEADEATKTLTVKYDNNDPIKTVRDALHELVVDTDTMLFCKEIGTTDLTGTLEGTGNSRGFHLFYATASV